MHLILFFLARDLARAEGLAHRWGLLHGDDRAIAWHVGALVRRADAGHRHGEQEHADHGDGEQPANLTDMMYGMCEMHLYCFPPFLQG